MLYFVNDRVVFSRDETMQRDFGARCDSITIRGEEFTRDEMRHIFENLTDILKTWRNAEERMKGGQRECSAVILTRPFSFNFVSEDEFPSAETLDYRTIKFSVLDELVHSIPTIARWL